MAKSAQDNDDPGRDDDFVAADADADLSSVKRKSRASSAPSAKPSGAAEAVEAKAVEAEATEAELVEADPTPPSGREFSLTINGDTLRKAALVLGALVVVALLAVGGWQWFSARQQVRAFNEVKAAATHFIVTSIEYTSSDKADKAKEVQGPLVTGKMRDELSQDREAATKAVRDQGIKATAKVDSIGVENISNNEATTLLIVTATGTSNLSPTPQKRTVALRLTLRREGGKWLVAESKGVGDFSGTGVNPQPGAPTPGAPVPTPN